MSLLPKIEETDTGASVLVLCVPTRHETPETAYRQVRALSARAAEKHIGCIFKKTDSALRGNVGAELAAVLDGSGEHELFFIPALPAMNRVTINGIHYINGVPVHESVFGDDPFEPVTESYIPALLEKQMNEPVEVITGATPPAPVNSGKRIAVLDCETQSGMEKLTRTLYESGRLHAVAGCSGLAEALAAALCGSVGETEAEPETERLTVVCGSMNPISLEQVAYAEKTGYAAVSVRWSGCLRQDSKAPRARHFSMRSGRNTAKMSISSLIRALPALRAASCLRRSERALHRSSVRYSRTSLTGAPSRGL